MVGKIIKQLNSINKYSKKIIISASFTSLIFCIAGISIILYNNINIVSSVFLRSIGSSLVCYSITIFTIFTIGSLIIDLFDNFVNNHNE